MPRKGYISRLVDERIKLYLSTFGAVCIEGPKWCGKTWTSLEHSASAFMLADPTDNFANRQLASLDVTKALAGKTPHLIDEWQEIPAIWDAVRYNVDQSTECGRYLLTGASTPLAKGVVHSGTGRIASIRMHPMSLFERGESEGAVSLKDVCEGKGIGVQSVKSPSLEDLAYFVVCGGWPGSLGKSFRQASIIPREYVENVIKVDMRKVDGIERDEAKVRKCLRSLARNESTTVSTATIRDDIAEVDDSSLGINTVTSYLDAFKRMFLTNDIEPFSPFLRSPTRIKQLAKRHFCDPSIAAALLGATERMLMRDLRTFGFLFESLALRDLQIYAEALGAELYHYQDYDGREIDAVVQFEDGAWSAFEIKLNPEQVDDAAEGLKKIAAVFRHNPPVALSVVVGKSGNAYRREDGVYVLPITALRA
jgi:hypothetical protein